MKPDKPHKPTIRRTTAPPVFPMFRHQRETEHGEAVRAYLKAGD